jgi:hypothetical protein
MKKQFPVTDPTQTVDYSSNVTPTNYVCGECGASGVKLWREYQTFLDHQSLCCVVCSGREQKKDINSINSGGFTLQEYGKTDQLGWRIPAIPTESNDAYWGYTSVPTEGVDWWRGLPAFPGNVREVKVGDFRNYLPGTPEYVYSHGVAKKKRGRKPSVALVLAGQRIADPKASFYLAKLLLGDTENTLFGKPFFRSEIDWAKEYEKHLNGPNAKISFEPKSGIDACDCAVCFYRDAPLGINPKRECQMANRNPQNFFGFTGPAKKVFMPPVVYGKNLGHFYPQWLSPFAE